MDGHAFGHVLQVPAQYLAHAEVSKKDRRAERDGTDAAGLEQESAAGNIGLQYRRILETDEAVLRVATFRPR